MRIIVGADFVPSEQNEQLFIDGKARELVGDKLYDIITGADISVFNLEIPLTDHDSPIKKSGAAFRADPKSINAYKALGVDVLGISNNHVLDHGLEEPQSVLVRERTAGAPECRSKSCL